MKTDSDQKQALSFDLVARSIELHSEYASRDLWVEQGKIDEWQERIDQAWKRLIEAENLLKD
jgi:hypothetical protein